MEMKNVYQKDGIKLNLSACLLLVALMVGGVGCGNTENNKLAAQVPIQSVTINVSSALVTPTYTLNGAAFAQSEYNDGNFVLRNTAFTSDTLVLGSSHDASPAAVRVIQDTYDVLFQHETGNGVPQNVDTQVQINEVVNSDRDIFIDVRAWEITPSFTQNASAFPLNEYDTGVFYLQPDAGGERIFIGKSHMALPAPVQVMQGTYDVIYSLGTGGEFIPNNQGAVVMAGVSITAVSALAVDVASVRFQFDATLDLAAFPADQNHKALFFLRNISTGDRVELGASFELPVTQSVIEGTYDIVYQHVRGSGLPVNTDAIVASNVVIDSINPSQNVDIRSVAITPGFTLDGSAFPQDEYNDANFYLRAVNNNNDVMFLGASEIASTVVRVISSDMDTDPGVNELLLGAYDVLYRHESGEEVPQNANALVPGKNNIVLNSDQALMVPVTSVNVAGRFTLNGNRFPGDINNSVQFLLRDSSNDSDEFLFGFSDISNEAVKLIPGTYHVVMDHLYGDAVPQNKMHEVDFNNVFGEDQTLNVNVPAVRVNPEFTLDGQAFPTSIYQSATFYLYDTRTETRIFLGRSYKKNTPVMVIKENHDIIYEHMNGDLVPQNTNNNLGVVDL
ncbi:MAG: hypothetical protein L3J98_02380 [Gammaproteobacteria bacterium]|nr:hypothetical protein [Gammaproteobacteria bacterium]MCF6259000.1 hypothetical protein [Gammaproteobacteria bacterium]